MKFRLLGPVEAHVEDRPVHLGGPKTRLMLAVLLEAQRRLVSTDRLIERVWDEGLPDESDPRDVVSSCASDLRGHLRRGEPGVDDLIPKRERGYRLLADPQDVDLHRFRAQAKKVGYLAGQNDAANDPQIARIGREALREWGDAGSRDGEPLAGLGGRWAIAVRQALRKEYRTVLISCLEAELRSGRGASLVPELEDLCHSTPLDERIVKLLMLAHYQAGDRLKAIAVFERFQQRVDDRYFTAPSQEIVELYRRIFEQDPTLHHSADIPPTGAAMPPPEIADLAKRMTKILAPALPFLTGAEMPQSDEHVRGDFWTMAKELWSVLHRRDAMARVQEAVRGGLDLDSLRAQLEGALAHDSALADEASAILGRKGAEESRAQINISGPYFHQGDNISGTSIKHYNG